MDEARQYRHVMQAVFGRPWAIERSKLGAIGELIRQRIDGFRVAPEVAAEIAAAARQPAKANSAGVIAVLPLYGTILWRVGGMEQMSGAQSLQDFSRAFDAAMTDERVKSIVIDVDSPGGQIDGIPETAAKVFAARGVKKVTAVINTLGCSAAYWLATAAAEVVVSPSAMVGSVGVYMLHEDDSGLLENAGVKMTFVSAPKDGHKTDGNPFEPLSEEAETQYQGMVDEIYGWFTNDVAKFRGVALAKVQGEEFGQGRVFLAPDALARGMVDRIATLDQVLGEARTTSPAEPAPPASPFADGAQFNERRAEIARAIR